MGAVVGWLFLVGEKEGCGGMGRGAGVEVGRGSRWGGWAGTRGGIAALAGEC